MESDVDIHAVRPASGRNVKGQDARQAFGIRQRFIQTENHMHSDASSDDDTHTHLLRRTGL